MVTRYISSGNVPDTLKDPRGTPVLVLASRTMDRRRSRGSAVNATSTVFAKVHPEANRIADEVAIRVGVSKAALVEALLYHLGNELDADGVPAWWTDPIPHPEELTLETA